MNKINFVSGETYTLSELFSGNRFIEIPDLQRDYCWGDENTGLVDGFIRTILEPFHAKDNTERYRKLNLGMIYGYESIPDYIQLCDGQQRITTLYLLIGMLNRWSGDNRFKKILAHHGEPYLKYAIRESSIYFIKDLVDYFFMGHSIENASDIQNAEWYFTEYSFDPSVLSMISALETIEKYEEEISAVGVDRFAEFVLEKLSFIYYDMGTRSQGEETFVVINTTGEPLTAVENLKPLVISVSDENKHYELLGKQDLDAAHTWEEMETWFWRNRDKSKYDTADAGFNEFLRWVSMLHQDTTDGRVLAELQILQNEADAGKMLFDYREISLDYIVDVFNSFVYVVTTLNLHYGNGDSLDKGQCFSFLPMLAYAMRFKACQADDLRRIGRFFANIVRIENVSRNITDYIASAIEIGKQITDICDVLGYGWISESILSREERRKLEIIKANPQNRKAIEEAFWHVQDKNVDEKALTLFKGQINPVIDWATDGVEFNLELFRHYSDLLDTIFKEKKSNDSTRRALLAWGMPGFPASYNDYLRFGWSVDARGVDKAGSWKTIIEANSDDFKRFLDDVACRGLDAIVSAPIESPWIMFVLYPQLLEYADTKGVGKWSYGWCVFKQSHAKPMPLVSAYALLMADAGLQYGWQKDGQVCFDKDSLETCVGALTLQPHILKGDVEHALRTARMLFKTESKSYGRKCRNKKYLKPKKKLIRRTESWTLRKN